MEYEYGRPRKYLNLNEPMVPMTARFTYWHIRFVRKLGNGVFSEGLRKLIEDAAKASEHEDLLAQPIRRDTT